MGLLSVAFFGALTVLPLYMQAVLGVSALQTGLVALPGALVMGFTGPLDRPDLRPLGHPGAADPRFGHRRGVAVVLHDVR